MKFGNILEGSTVISQYRARWTGVVINLEKRKDANPLATVKVIIDQHGNPMRKPITKTLDASWLKLKQKIILDGDGVRLESATIGNGYGSIPLSSAKLYT